VPSEPPAPVRSAGRDGDAGSLIERASLARTEAARSPVPAQRFELPPDMVMIETSPAAKRPDPEPEDAPEPVRQRRQRPAAETAPPEPLVQIETRK
jgi:hypothetical protein